ncbi:MAG: hypothetical protein EOO59_11140 [Hymenobacter sp.]|nr:MAG: hypothetical protein EOO59_11140 [Hymenobacter sp.]
MDEVNQVAGVRPVETGLTPALHRCAGAVWSFVRCKKGQRWLWWVENAANGQVAALVFGRRTPATFRCLLALLSGAGWAVAQWLPDAWGAYAAYLPAEAHQVGKAAMHRLERKHLTLRTRRKRLTRRTICFSKKQFFHEGLITLSIFHFFF